MLMNTTTNNPLHGRDSKCTGNHLTLTVNGEPRRCRGESLLEMLRELEVNPERVAVMLNGRVVASDQHAVTRLHSGDSVDIVYFAGGGVAAEEAPLRLGDCSFTSRLILGTGKFPDSETMVRSVRASGVQLVTVALRRFNPAAPSDDLHEPLSRLAGVTIMPNTSGARTAAEAVRAALLGRELSGSPLVKLEIHPNPYHLLPDPVETYAAARLLVKEGFAVMPYIPADPVLAKRLEDIGCASVMPLGAPIGSGGGLETRRMLELILRDSLVPVIVDAGIRAPSEAAAAMEMGCAAVLVNSAVAVAENPPDMAACFAEAVRIGWRARAAGMMPRGDRAVATSPLTSFLAPRPDGEPGGA